MEELPDVTATQDKKYILGVMESILENREYENGENYARYRLKIIELRNSKSTRGLRYDVSKVFRGIIPGSGNEEGCFARVKSGDYFFQIENIWSIQEKKRLDTDRTKRRKNGRRVIKELYIYFNKN